MEKQRSTKVIALIAMLVAIVGVSIGFAAMSTQLNIAGTAEMNPATWSIKFENLSAASVTGAATEVTAPTINGTSTTIGTYAVNLTKPGDSVKYIFDIKNAGTMNAILSSFTKSATPTCVGTGANAIADAALVCANLVYSLKYTVAPGDPITQNDTLTAGQARQAELLISYPSSVTVLPDAKVTITGLGITLVYTQN